MLMAKLLASDTKHVANLAKLQLSDEEIEKFTKQLAKVLVHIEELEKVDVKNTTPTAQTTGLHNILRKDEIKPENMLTQDEALSGTENIVNGFIAVKKILNKDE
jgi:aspartyl-tRNA(Asn)/glutamyl-tRNA(Gln) amidotransferase subunit C